MSNSNKPRNIYNPFYFIFDAFRNLWRHRVTGIASVLVLSSCLILLGAFGLLIRNIDVNMEKLGLLNEIVVFTDYDVRITDEYGNILAEANSQTDNVEVATFTTLTSGKYYLQLYQYGPYPSGYPGDTIYFSYRYR